MTAPVEGPEDGAAVFVGILMRAVAHAGFKLDSRVERLEVRIEMDAAGRGDGDGVSLQLWTRHRLWAYRWPRAKLQLAARAGALELEAVEGIREVRRQLELNGPGGFTHADLEEMRP